MRFAAVKHTEIQHLAYPVSTAGIYYINLTMLTISVNKVFLLIKINEYIMPEIKEA